jgi:hypothetical protein
MPRVSQLPESPGMNGGPAPGALALFEEALRKSAVLWIRLPSLSAPRAAWHVWVDGGAAIVHEGNEQQLPGLIDAPTVTVIVRSKDKGGLLIEGEARVVPLRPDDDRWETAVAALHAARQSPPDGEQQPARWATDSMVTRLEPTAAIVQLPGTYDDGGGRAVPVPTAATTLDELPRVVGRRARRRPRL